MFLKYEQKRKNSSNILSFFNLSIHYEWEKLIRDL